MHDLDVDVELAKRAAQHSAVEGGFVNILPVQQHAAAGRAKQARKQMEECGLAAACAPHHADERAVLYRNADVAKRMLLKGRAGRIYIGKTLYRNRHSSSASASSVSGQAESCTPLSSRS